METNTITNTITTTADNATKNLSIPPPPPPSLSPQAFLSVLDQCPKIEVDVPLVKSYLAQFAARAVIGEQVSMAELAHPLENGTHFPLFLLCLQQTAKLKDREWLTDLFQQSHVNMQKMLPGTFLWLLYTLGLSGQRSGPLRSFVRRLER